MPLEKISHFEIKQTLGAGGMGVVYKALDTKLNRNVAVKALARHIAHNPEFRKRFLIEAQAVAALNHPNIATIYETREEGNEAYIIMEFIEGEELSKKLSNGKLEILEALDYSIQIAEGLKTAHQKGIVHRDIKSQNIMVTGSNQIKIMDFGLAKLTGQSMMTQLGTTVGTINYMSPEQSRGEEIDQRTDLWALGIVLYEMVTGSLPFKASYEQAIIYSILNEEPKSVLEIVKDIPKEIDQVIKNLLSKNPDNRYQDADELLIDLKTIKQSMETGIPVEHLKSGSGTADYINKLRSEKNVTAKFSRKRMVTISSVIVVLFLIILFKGGEIRKLFSGGLLPDEIHLAVLPFDNIGSDITNSLFCDGIVETLTSQLSQFEQFEGALWVVPSSEIRKGKITSAEEAYKKFAINLALTGSVQKMNRGYRLTLTLIDAENKRQLASRIIDDPMTNNSYLQDEAIVKVADMLNIELKPENIKMLMEGKTSNAEAYELYLKGKGYMLNHDKMDNVNAAIALFDQATKKDSLYALAYAGSGEANLFKYIKTKDISFIEAAIKKCNRANELNDKLIPVRITLGSIYLETGKFDEAKIEFQKVLEIDPHNSEAYNGKANAFLSLGLPAEAEASYKKAIKMKPSYWGVYNSLGSYYFRQGNYREAAAQFQQVVTLAPNNSIGYRNLGTTYINLDMPEKAIEIYNKSLLIQKDYRVYSDLAATYFQMGNYVDAARAYESVLKINKTDYNMWGYLASCYFWIPNEKNKVPDAIQKAIALAEPQLMINPNNIDLLCDLASFYGMLKDRSKTKSLLNQVEKIGPKDVYQFFYIGDIYEEWLGERETALKWFKSALEKGFSVKRFYQTPGLKNLIADGKFNKLLKTYENK